MCINCTCLLLFSLKSVVNICSNMAYAFEKILDPIKNSFFFFFRFPLCLWKTVAGTTPSPSLWIRAGEAPRSGVSGCRKRPSPPLQTSRCVCLWSTPTTTKLHTNARLCPYPLRRVSFFLFLRA